MIEDLFKEIKESINVDNFNYYKEYKGKNRALYLERVVYKCPVCKKEHTLYSKGNKIICSSCGLEVNYNSDLTLSSSNEQFDFKYIKDWYNYQIEEIKKLDIKDEDLIYSEEVTLVNPRKYKSKKKIGKGLLEFYGDKLVFKLNKGTLEFNFDDIEEMAILGKKKMNFYVENKTYQFFGDKKINMLKYVNMFYLIRNKKRGNSNDFMGI